MASVESEVIRYDGCFVCGLQNPIGLNLKFVSDGETVRTEFSPKPEHEGYKGILHGGILAAIIDEVMIKVPLARNIVCLTASMEVRFKSPATIRDTLYFEGKIEEHKGRVVSTKGIGRTAEGRVVIEATGKYLVVSPEMRAQLLQTIST